MSKGPLIDKIILKSNGNNISCSIFRNQRSRRISLRVVSRDEVILNVPPRGSLSEAKDFVATKMNWVIEKTGEMPASNELAQFLKIRPMIWLDSRPRSFRWSFSNSSVRSFCSIGSDVIEAVFPDGKKEENEALLSCLIKLGKEHLPLRLQDCAEKVGLSYRHARVGNQKTRWGSCSSRQVISLNWRILLLDYSVGDYVLFHELAHLKHMNHSSQFWKLLQEWVPDARMLDVKLSSQGKELMLLGRN